MAILIMATLTMFAGDLLLATFFYLKKHEKHYRNQISSLRWRHNGRDSVSNHQPYDCLLNRFFRRRWKKTSKLRVTGLCVGNSPGTGEFPAQMASNAENVSIWWRHHVLRVLGWVRIGCFYISDKIGSSKFGWEQNEIAIMFEPWWKNCEPNRPRPQCVNTMRSRQHGRHFQKHFLL